MSQHSPKQPGDLSARQRHLLELMLRERRQKQADQESAGRRPIPRRAPDAPPVLSFAQQRMWFIQQFQPGTAAYNIPSGVRLKGPLLPELLVRSVEAVSRRQEVLRTTFALVDRRPQQLVAARPQILLPLVDVRALPAGRREAEAQKIIDGMARTPFEMAVQPPWRVLLVRVADQEHIFLVVMHHIISDTWTTGVFFREMVGHYQHLCDGGPLRVPELPIQYADYAVWQRGEPQGERLGRQIAYWRNRLAGAPELLDLPLDRPRPATPSFRGGRVRLLLPDRLTNRLKQRSTESEATLFMTFMAGFQTLLFRVTQQRDLIVATPMANRDRVELEHLIGLFVNTLVLRTDFAGNPSFRRLLGQVRETTLEGLANHDVPFEQVVEELDLERDTSRNPLFQVIFAFQNVPIPKLVAKGLTLERFEFRETTARLDLELDLQEMPYGFVGWLGYNSDLFDATTIRRLTAGFQRLLEAVADDPEQPIGSLPLLSAAERHQLIGEWNDTASGYPRQACIHELFAEQAAHTPGAMAVRAAGRQLTYGELEREANRLARRLQRLGAGPEVRVAVHLERSAEMIVAVLAILKAGGAYLPLDPSLPRQRLVFLVADTAAPILITVDKLSKALPPTAARVVCLDSDAEKIAAESAEAPEACTRPENLAYVNYTSGSTGEPKGVAVPHRAVVRLVRETDFASLSADQVFLQLAPISFDASTLEIWGSLVNGAQLVVYPGEKVALAELGEVLARYRVSTLWLTAGLFHLMMDERPAALRGVGQLLAGGDVLSVPHVRKRLAEQGGGVLINGYGPTEGTTFTCCHRMRAGDEVDLSVSIGRPIAGTRVYVLDRQQQPVPIGVVGELWIGGDGLARGYLDRPAATAEAFVPDPISGEVGARLYRSGDLVRFLPAGRLEFLGRFDHQVKIRGFRIELGEIETVLRTAPGVADCVVVARADGPGGKQLVAYVVAGEPDPEPLRNLVREKLPDYMCPGAFVFLEALPLNANGKVDRAALPAPAAEAPAGEQYVAPRGEMEERIAELWRRALGLERVGRDESFFEIGGNSLLLAQVHNDLLAVAPDLKLVDMFQYPTVGALAELLAGGDRPGLGQTLESAVDRRRAAASDKGREIAVIGMALRFPGANNPDEFWKNLINGIESVLAFGREEALAAGAPARLVDDPNYVLAEGSIDHVDTFDHEFFGFADPQELELVDPQQRIFMENAWEALECAGYDPRSYPGTIGIFGGANISSYMFSNLLSHHDPLDVMSHFLTRIGILAGNQGDFLCPRIAYQLDLTGPVVGVQTACSTALVAIHLACESLLRRECDMCLAGGVQIRVPQKMGYLYQPGGFPSPDGRCRSFDAKAQGNVHGNGSGIVLLKRLADAVADGDHVYAVVKGAALANDGAVKVGFTAPGVAGQARAAAEALAVAGVGADSIGYLEAAGTATELGDPIEIQALTEAYRLSTDKKGYCPIGCVKTNVGHLDVASGMAAFIKTAQTLERGMIPPSLHFEQPNPNIDFDASPFFVNAELRPWPPGDRPRRAAIHTYAVGGTNAHLILEEPPAVESAPESRPWQLLLLSARSSSALYQATVNLREHLERHPELNIADVAYTLQVGRRAFPIRQMLLCQGPDDGLELLESLDPDRVLTEFEPQADAPVAFLFPQPEVLRPGATGETYRSEPTFRQWIDRCSEILQPHLELDLRTVLYPGADTGAPSLNAPRLAQPALFAIEYALAQLWREWGLVPAAMLGDGIGEVVAACLAQVLTLADALLLAVARGEALANDDRRRLDRFSAAIRDLNFQPPQTPYLASLTARRAEAGEVADVDYWCRQLTGAGRLADSLRQLIGDQPPVLLEVGPGSFPDAEAHAPLILASLPAGDGESEGAQLLCSLGQLWLAGVSIDWVGFYRHERRLRVPLPTYPFERRRVWIEPPQQAAPRPAQPDANARRPLDEWFYAPCWHEQHLFAEPISELGEGQGWLVLSDGSPFSARIGQRLAETGQRVVNVRCGESFERLRPGSYRLAPDREEDYRALCDALSAEQFLPARVIHLWSLAAESGAGSFEDAQRLGFWSLIYLGRTLADSDGGQVIEMGVVTTGLRELSGEEKLRWESASILAATTALTQEHPRLCCWSADVLPPPPGSWDEVGLVDNLLREFGRRDLVAALAYRRGHRYVRTFEPLPLPPRQTMLRADGVYLITDGSAGYGLRFADFVARAVRAQIVLISSVALPPAAEWTGWVEEHPPDDPISTRIRQIRVLEDGGTKVVYLTADVTDAKRMRAIVEDCCQRFGRIDGLIHAPVRGGALAVPLPVAEIDPESFAAHCQDRVRGAVGLAEALHDKSPDFCLLIGSLASILGGDGVVAAAAADCWLEVLALCLNRAGGTRWRTVGWDDRTDETVAIRPGDGPAVLQRVLCGGDLPPLAVCTSDLVARIDLLRQAHERAADDRKRRPRPDLETPFVAAGNEVEEVICELWQQLFGFREVGIHDNFFELGGDSLLAAQLVARLRNLFAVDLSLREVLELGTVAGIAAAFRERQVRLAASDELEDLLVELDEMSEQEAVRLAGMEAS